MRDWVLFAVCFHFKSCCVLFISNLTNCLIFVCCKNTLHILRYVWDIFPFEDYKPPIKLNSSRIFPPIDCPPISVDSPISVDRMLSSIIIMDYASNPGFIAVRTLIGSYSVSLSDSPSFAAMVC